MKIIQKHAKFKPIRGDIHTQVATLNVSMTLESETPTPSSLTSSVASNIPFVS